MSVLSPRELRRLANLQFSSLVLAEVGRARKRVTDLERAYPSADRDELARRLIDKKRAIASTSGAVSGLFGLASVPLDLVLVSYLQISLMVDVATLCRVSLKSARAQDELLDLLGRSNGVDPAVRAGPKVLGRIAIALLERKGLPVLGRAVPVVAAPVTAWLNNKALARAGREAFRFYTREGRREQRNPD